MAETVLTNTGLDRFLELVGGAPEHRGPAFARAAEAVLGLLALRGADRGTGVPEPTPELTRQLLLEDLPAFVYVPPGELALYPAVLGALAARFDGSCVERIAAVVAETAPDFERAMHDPGNLTWHRWYASLLRTCGADLADPEDVRRRLAALDGAPLPDGARRADLMGRTALADVLLTEALTRAYVRDAEEPPPVGPLLTDHAVATGIGRVATALRDRWTAAGLAEQLAGPYAHYAPGPDAFPHLVLADALLDEHLDHHGDPAVPVPPPPAIEHGSAETDADTLLAAVEELAEEEFEPYGGEAPHLLYVVYQRGCSAESVARKAAEYEDWTVDPALEDLPVPVPDGAPGAYAVPPVPELVRLLGTPGLDEVDRARLEGPARDLAAVLDRLAATGLVFRTGDAFGLTPRGAGAVRYLLGVRGVAAPDAAEAAAWPATVLVAAAGGWPAPVAARVLADRLHARVDTAHAWTELLDALGTVHAGTSEAAATRGLFAVLDTTTAPPEALRAALRDPVLGAYALRALEERGEEADPIQVPTSARALHVLDALPAKKGPLESRRAAFDAAAAAWPGGSAALVRAMAEADRHEAERVLGPLGIALP
ncbi:hypothetical protein GCM10010497_62620 [Streptomyces cinereoruber]|uniref:Helicase XPB/Ssl2 N-terminal domain-containing protein n=1 Tax=Streptomyces cinereoruber TaxID=67260 RepID=A0AAV4KS96_9ACTN|nr:hypothetical protein [Streptomyces cinereoruber]MBB4157586.1 hypothetical protein [Streptomyces cinereoruber]MBY8819951.1 hypothetical protein [Streptomyces cinereoruber]NIH62261.1 hypothetical protein [Streptomyces cinereoruber]QEV35476.1 hypothetical protein CP977_27630 [Streptomyces cinereoruber]GGR50709.1 hypothetical protein GCM10010497_62620 [Streptomyces cinereoruber]